MSTTLRQHNHNEARPLRSDQLQATAIKRPSLLSLFPAARQSRPIRTPTEANRLEGGVASADRDATASTSSAALDRRLSISSVSSSVTSDAVSNNNNNSQALQLPTTKASSSLIVKTAGRPPRFKRLYKRRSSKNKNMMANSEMTNGGPPENVMQWLEACCPNDVVPKVLAYCGPQITATLMATNSYWFQLIAREDGTWRSLCEGMYKWQEGRDPMPESWKEFYRLHPCVPTDYSTIPKALAVVTEKKSNNGSVSQYIRSSGQSKREQTESIEILLRPGKHVMKESLVVHAGPDVSISLKTLDLPRNRFYSPRFALAEQEHAQSCPEPKSKARNASIRQWMGCKSNSVMEGANGEAAATVDSNFYDSDSSDNSLVMLNSLRRGSLNLQDSRNIHILATNTSSLYAPPKYPERATVVLRTRRQNEPIIRVRQGSFKLNKVDLEHASQGVDIWNGNAAVQVQPPMGADNEPALVEPRPSVELTNVSISSKSGRGVVCLDGGNVVLRQCMIHDCAATGLYIGGPGSEADIHTTDVIRNGIGSRIPTTRAPRVTAGHSGVYLEQGLAQIRECNISSNHLTGISVVSPDNAILKMEKSDLVANGNGNLDMPPPGSVSYDQSEVANDNNMAAVGRPCLRSNLELPARLRPRVSF